MILLCMLRRVFIRQVWVSPLVLLLDEMYVCMYPASTVTSRAVTTTQVVLKCLHAKFQTWAMNSHGGHSQTCLFNSYSNGGYHTIPWQARVISSVDTIYISAFLYSTWCAGWVARVIEVTAWQSVDAICHCCPTPSSCVEVTGPISSGYSSTAMGASACQKRLSLSSAPQ